MLTKSEQKSLRLYKAHIHEHTRNKLKTVAKAA
jgi:hypothetical protein